MLPNAIPPLITVTLFSFVWQYNDTFYTSLFMSEQSLMPLKIASLPADANQFLPALMGLGSSAKADPNYVALVVDTGILLAILPLIDCICSCSATLWRAWSVPGLSGKGCCRTGDAEG